LVYPNDQGETPVKATEKVPEDPGQIVDAPLIVAVGGEVKLTTGVPLKVPEHELVILVSE
jgi:hypothetical protein